MNVAIGTIAHLQPHHPMRFKAAITAPKRDAARMNSMLAQDNRERAAAACRILAKRLIEGRDAIPDWRPTAFEREILELLRDRNTSMKISDIHSAAELKAADRKTVEKAIDRLSEHRAIERESDRGPWFITRIGRALLA